MTYPRFRTEKKKKKKMENYNINSYLLTPGQGFFVLENLQ